MNEQQIQKDIQKAKEEYKKTSDLTRTKIPSYNLETTNYESIDVFKHFRKNLRLLLIEKEIGADELSTKLGFSRGRLSNFLKQGAHHYPNVSELVVIAMYFNVPIDDLIHIPIS